MQTFNPQNQTKGMVNTEPSVLAEQTVIERFYDAIIYDNDRMIELNNRLERLVNRFEGSYASKTAHSDLEEKQKEPNGLNEQISFILKRFDSNLNFMSCYITSLEKII